MRIVTVFLAVLCVALGVMTVSAAQAELWVNPASEYVVSAIEDQHQYHPRLWRDFVVWHVSVGGDVYAKNIVTGDLVPISVGEGGSDYVNIHDGRVVWGEWAGGSPVWLYDLSTSSKSQITSAGESPDISGNIVVWEDNHTIKGKYIGGSGFIVPGTGSQTSAQRPAVSGDNVVWTDDSYIKGYNLSSQASFVVSSAQGANWTPPDICGDIVVWEDYRNGNRDIYGADISDPENIVEFAICTNPGEQSAPQVYDNIVVWSGGGIYGYDLETMTEFAVATGPSGGFSPAIHENTVMWSSQVGDQTDIHGNVIVPEPATLLVMAAAGLAILRRQSKIP